MSIPESALGTLGHSNNEPVTSTTTKSASEEKEKLKYPKKAKQSPPTAASSGGDFVYDPEFFFDRPKEGDVVGQEAGEQNEERKWITAISASVPFDEKTFWMVMNRWVLEVAKIIPPVASVDVLSDSTCTVSSSAKVSMTSEADNNNTEWIPQRRVQRQLNPKRTDKDAILQEILSFYSHSPIAVLQPIETTEQQPEQESSSCTSIPKIELHPQQPIQLCIKNDTDPSKCYAVYEPVLAPVSPRTLPQQDDDEETNSLSRLPFYYPKVRAFRYSFRTDREEDVEEHETIKNCSCGNNNNEEESVQEEGPEKKKRKKGPKPIKKKVLGQGGLRAQVQQQVEPARTRIGWITLDLFVSNTEMEVLVADTKIQYAFKELFKKLFKWGVNTTKGYTSNRVQHDVLVPKEHYLATYARMKTKYAQYWIDHWPEKTDPGKFVFEDIAIASWLISLWEIEQGQEGKEQKSNETTTEQPPEKCSTEQQTVVENNSNESINTSTTTTAISAAVAGTKRKRTLSFVDLGCGNGLLTHLLISEGYKGTGIDISSRKVWEAFGTPTSDCLKAHTLIPNEATYEGTDWIIGNHADELAPWIPIIAARSSTSFTHQTKFVVIPCCFFGLSGARYQFPNGFPEGKYKAYQDYLKSIMTETCGFRVEMDVLRIPSTKNVVMVGYPSVVESTVTETTMDTTPSTLRIATEKRIEALVDQSGIFVPRKSDKEKQEELRVVQKTKMENRKTVQSSTVVAENELEKRTCVIL